MLDPSQELKTINDQSAQMTKKKSHLGLIIIHIFAILAFIAVSGAAIYLYLDNASKSEKLEKYSEQVVSSTISTISLLGSTTSTTVDNTTVETIVAAAVAPSATAISNIQGSVTTGNTQPLEGYMSDSVNVILAASEAYGPRTAGQAALLVSDYIGDSTTTTWDFALSASVLAGYATSGYSQYFPANAIVGKSSTNKLISFSFDSNAKIRTVFLAPVSELVQ